MILDPTLTAAYVVLAAALAFSPGPDVVFVIANGMQYRARGAIAAALGIGFGSLLHGVAAALGVSAVIAASPLAFEIMRIMGALYLAFLGLQALRSFLDKAYDKTGLSATDQPEMSVRSVFIKGFVTNILNPKVIVFYLALLPQFVNVELGHVGLQIFLLGSIHNVIGIVFLIAVGLGAGKASDWLSHVGFSRWLDGIAGVFFIGLAIRLILIGRTEN